MNPTINPFLKQKITRIDPDATLLHRFRSLFREKSTRHLTKMFHLLCSLGSAEGGVRISLAQFKKGMEKFVNGKDLLSALDLAKIFYMINSDGSGKLTSGEFIQHVQGNMSTERQKVVQFVFSRLKNNNSSDCIEEPDLVKYWTDMETKGCQVSSNAVATKPGLFLHEYGTHGKITQPEFIDYYMNLNFLTQNDRTQFISSCLNDWGMTRSDYDKMKPRSTTIDNLQEKKMMVKPTSPIHISASCDAVVDPPNTQSNVQTKVHKADVHAVDNLIPTNKKGTNHRHDDMGMTRRGHDVYTQKDQRFDNLKQPIPTRPSPSLNWTHNHPSFAEGMDGEQQPTIVLQPTAAAGGHSFIAVNKDTKPVPIPLIVVASELQKETSTAAMDNMDKFDALARLALADKAHAAAAQNPRDGRNHNVSIHCKSLHGYGSSSLVPKPPSVGSPRKRGMIINSDPTTDNSGYSRDNTDGSYGYSSSDYSPAESANITRSTSPNTVIGTKDLSTNDSITGGGSEPIPSSDQFIKNRSSHGQRTSSPRSRQGYGHYTNIEITDYELDRSISNHRDDDMDRSVSGHAVALEAPSLMQREPSRNHFGENISGHGLGSSRHGLGGSRHGALHTSFADQLCEQASSALPSIHPTIVPVQTSVAVPILKRQTSSSRNSFDYLNAFAESTSTVPSSSSSSQQQQQSSWSPHKSGGEQMISINQRDMETIMKRLADLEVTVGTLQKQLKDQQVHLLSTHPVAIPKLFIACIMILLYFLFLHNLSCTYQHSSSRTYHEQISIPSPCTDYHSRSTTINCQSYCIYGEYTCH